MNRAGDILLLEANATMVLVRLSADRKWDCRRPAFDKVAAVHIMLVERAAGGAPRKVAASA